jgi:hypothetical protein
VSGSWDHLSLGTESSGKHVTDGFEDRRVAARDYQRAETRLAKISERNLRGPRVAAAHQKASPRVKSWRQGIRQLCLNTHELKETSKELTRRGRVACEVRAYLFHRPADVFLMNSYRVRHRLYESQGVDGSRLAAAAKSAPTPPYE